MGNNISPAVNQFGLHNMALQLGFVPRPFGNGIIYDLPQTIGNGWLTHFHIENGLFISSLWFTPESELTYTFSGNSSFLWILAIDTGDIVISRQGKPAKHCTSRIHFIVHNKKSLRVTFPARTHVCFTSLMISEELLSDRNGLTNGLMAISLERIKDWKEEVYNSEDVLLLLEQVKWAARNGLQPLAYYRFKVGELFSLVETNLKNFWLHNQDRRYHVTWENEQKIRRIKAILDQDILNPPPVEKLSMAEAISTSKLRRCFKSLFHITIMEYIHMEKMKKALLLLADDELSIKNIAVMCGYESPGKFSGAFKKVHQITPSEYRKIYNL